MAQVNVTIGFKLHWWVRPALLAACWGAYPVLWLLGDKASYAYVIIVTGWLGRIGIGRCKMADADYEVTMR